MGVGWLPMNDSNHLDSKKHVFFISSRRTQKKRRVNCERLGFLSGLDSCESITDWANPTHSLGGDGWHSGCVPFDLQAIDTGEGSSPGGDALWDANDAHQREQCWLACLLLSPFLSFWKSCRISTQAAALIDIESADSSQTCRRWLLW